MGKHQDHSDNIAQWLRLRGADGIGPTTFSRLLERYETPNQALKATPTDLKTIEGIGPATAERIIATRNHFAVDQELNLADREGVYLIHLHDERYPAPLKAIYDPPPILYIKGQLQRAHALAVAFVGSRRCSIYGQEQASRLAYQLGNAGFTIVSGMARGIDTAAHYGALSAGAQTLAVQGCGLAKRFPPENRQLFDKIATTGACISEYTMLTDPLPHHFPARNRIISGLSQGTVIVEAALRSGALITARTALNQNREVMAIPGRIDSALSQGPLKLLKEGATMVTCMQDIVEALGSLGQGLKDHVEESIQELKQRPSTRPSASRTKLNPDEERIYQQLSNTPLHTDHLVQSTQLSAGTVTASLVTLQLKGLIKTFPGNLYVRQS